MSNDIKKHFHSITVDTKHIARRGIRQFHVHSLSKTTYSNLLI